MEKTGGERGLISNLAIIAVSDTFRKTFCGRLRKQKENEEKQVRRASEAQLIEGAGLRKHLPVWRAEHLSDPARIRWFPCLRYLPASSLWPRHYWLPRATPFSTTFIDLKRACHFPVSLFPPERKRRGETCPSPPWCSLTNTQYQFNKPRAQSSARPLTSALTTQTRQP